MHYRFQHVVNPNALLGADQDRVAGIDADHLLDLLANPLGLCCWQVDLVDDGNNLEVVVESKVRIGEGLSFDPLRGVDHQQRAFTGLQAPGDFVREIDVAGRIDQVQLVEIAVIGLVIQADGVSFDGDPALALEVHGIEDLLHHLALGEGAGHFEQPVGQRRFSMIDVRDDGEIADELPIHVRRGLRYDEALTPIIP